MEIKEHAFLISGGGSGLGAAAARALVAAGGKTVIADIDDDGIDDIVAAGFSNNIVKWYKVDISYPEQVSLKVGTLEIFNKADELDLNVQHSTDFSTEVNSYLTANQGNSYSDDYGNNFIDLKVTTESATEGRITMLQRSILR